MNTKTLKMMYTAITENIITHGILTCSGVLNSNIEALNVTQTWIIKTSLKKPVDYSTNKLQCWPTPVVTNASGGKL